MTGGTEAFPSLGRHCAEEYCHQLDFLPFTCDSCQKVFCLEHRSYKAHMCEKADLKDTTVVICPTCSAAVKKSFGESVETTLQNHNRDGCSLAPPSPKPKCPVKGCREKLTFSNTCHCKSCGTNTCLRHRYSSDHQCQAKRTGRLLEILAKRNASDCASASKSTPSTKGNNPMKDIDRQFVRFSIQEAH